MKTLTISDLPLAMHYQLAINHVATANYQWLIANASPIANCQSLMETAGGSI
jgi:hypothetical protein